MEEKDKDKPETTPSQSATVTIKNNTTQIGFFQGQLDGPIAAKPNPHSSTGNSPTAPKLTINQTLDDFSSNSDSGDNDSSSEESDPELEKRVAARLQGKLTETQTEPPSQDSRLKKFRYREYDPHLTWQKSTKSGSQTQDLKTPKAPVPIKNPRLQKVTHQTSDGQFFETIIDTTEEPQITLRKKSSEPKEPKNEGLKSIIKLQVLRPWRPVPILLALFTLAASIALYAIGGMGSGVAYDGLVFLFKFLPWNPVISILVVATFFAALSAFAIYNSLGTQRVITMTEDNLPSSAPVGVPKGQLDVKGDLAPTSNPTHAPPVFKAIPSVIEGVDPNLITTKKITQDL